ncbi:hypothetical protein QN277_023979 [Acacia crassicarpa]|uniref:Uncharacterized protein n=1 Tax=Acacia crassicarpa TaxID=499986 RepID=A0AAE1MGW2_9FABA|nr:hypothetical protein QN277_023979 [Acacia crassicarpa]
MAKLGKLTKLKSAISRWPSFPKLGGGCGTSSNSHRDQPHRLSAAVHSNKQQQPLHAVYVGKSRRRYLVNSDVLEHPVFQELVDRSASPEEEEEDCAAVVVACEVVLFEHLLWMLQNNETQMGSLHELADFYNCAC